MAQVETRVLGHVRQDGSDKPLALDGQNNTLVSGGMPWYAEVARKGNCYSVIATDAIAGLVVRPDTVAALTLWNGEPAGSKRCYIVDRLFSHCLVSGNEEGRFMIWACIHPAGKAAVTSELAPAATNFIGSFGKTYNGRAIVELGATVADNGWFPWGYSTDYEKTGVLPGSAVSVDVAGRLIIPPTGAISLHVVSSINDATFCSGLTWCEELLTLGV